MRRLRYTSWNRSKEILMEYMAAPSEPKDANPHKREAGILNSRHVATTRRPPGFLGDGWRRTPRVLVRILAEKENFTPAARPARNTNKHAGNMSSDATIRD